MRMIIRLFALPIVVAAIFSGCNNKPPFERLILAVDSVNAFYKGQPEMTAPDAQLVYDQVTNTVKFNYELPSAEVAEFYKDNIGVSEDILLSDVLPEAPCGLYKEIVDAEANIMIVYDWGKDGHSEYLITADRVRQSYDNYKKHQEAMARNGRPI
ncbi:MAG: hypothetical protein Q4C34_06245 [Bacteroidales bacterium]|nr:hypothetical protein [Bacteroidales bacterium]